MIADALAEQGLEIPDDLQPVDVWPVAEPYRVAFQVLSASRGKGVDGVEALKYSEIVIYAEGNGYATSIDELAEFVAFVQMQDAEFRANIAKLSENG